MWDASQKPFTYYLMLKREVETAVPMWVIWFKFCVFFKATHDGSLKVRFAVGVCILWVVCVCMCLCVALCWVCVHTSYISHALEARMCEI